MLETSRRLVLRYDRGQFSFRHFDHDANDENLLELARALNSFQTDTAEEVLHTTVYEFGMPM